MQHDIVIIIGRIATLRGATGSNGSLDTLETNAQMVDARIGTPSEGEDDHAWLESVEDTLGTMVDQVACLNNGCP